MKTSNRISHIPTSFIRQILQIASRPEVISFAGGVPEERLFPVTEILESTQRILSNKPEKALQYGPTEGILELRTEIAARYQRKGIPMTEDNIMITNGSQQGLDLIGKLFLDKGDSILLESPSYLGAIQCFSQYECRFEEIDLEPDGLNIEMLEDKTWEQHHRFLYMIPDFQNPTGYQYSLEKRKRIGKLLSEKQIPIIEDSPYSELNFEHQQLPSMLELFPGNTIQLGSFSKILAPGLRTGWIAAPQAIIHQLKILKQASDLQSNSLAQYIILDLLQQNILDRHIPRLQHFYKERRDAMCEQLNTLRDELSFSIPSGGMFCWITLKRCTSEELLQECMKENLVFVPGHHFYANNKNEFTARINFTRSNPEQIKAGIEIMRRQLARCARMQGSSIQH